MKRRSLLQYLGRRGCVIVREGRRHTIVKNRVTGAESQVPRHREIKSSTAKAICKDLGVDPPRAS
jgi:hypothetical protein